MSAKLVLNHEVARLQHALVAERMKALRAQLDETSPWPRYEEFLWREAWRQLAEEGLLPPVPETGPPIFGILP